MSHAFLFVPAAGQTEAPGFEKGVRALADFKGVQITDSASSATASLAVAPAAKATQVAKGRIARSADGQALRNLLDKNSLTSGFRVEQWRRLLTLEALTRILM